MASKAELENAIRNDFVSELTKFISEKYETDVLMVGAGKMAIPVVDAEGNEKFAIVDVSIPRGTRNAEGSYDPYDGYAAAEDYQMELADREEKRKASEKKKAEAQRKKDEKKAEREAKKNLLEIAKLGRQMQKNEKAE